MKQFFNKLKHICFGALSFGEKIIKQFRFENSLLNKNCRETDWLNFVVVSRQNSSFLFLQKEALRSANVNLEIKY